MIFDLKDLTTVEKQHYLQHVVAPRPVCFASTIDKAGNINLSPFSFFNLFSFTIGGFIKVAGSSVKPAFVNSFTSPGNSQLDRDTW